MVSHAPAYATLLYDLDLLGLLPEVYLCTAVLGLLVVGVVASSPAADTSAPLVTRAMAGLLMVALVYTLVLLWTQPCRGLLLQGTYALDAWSLWSKALLVVGSLVTLALSRGWWRHAQALPWEVVVLMGCSLVGLWTMVSAENAITLYLGMELHGLSAYVLAASARRSEFATEAGLKYFLLGAFASGVVLFGWSLVYGVTGTTSYPALSLLLSPTFGEAWTGSPVLTCQVGLACLLVGLLWKLAAVPFHMWSPDVYEGAPMPVTAYFLLVPKVAFVAALARLCLEPFGGLQALWHPVLLASGLASLVVGALGTLAQRRWKRFLAWSSIGHGGWVLVALASGTLEGGVASHLAGLQALVLYMMVYMAMTAGTLAVITLPLQRSGGVPWPQALQITDLTALATTHPALALALATLLFSMAGVPPLGGFYAKALVLLSSMEAGMYLVSGVAVATSALSCYYYIRVIKVLYFEPPTTWARVGQVPPMHALVLATAVVGLLCVLLWPEPMRALAYLVATSLL